MQDTALPFKSVTEIAPLIMLRQVSPVELTQALLTRIAQLDSRLKSYATVMDDHALRAAKMAEQEIGAGTYRGPLHGVPVAVKDLVFTQGVRTMGGTKVLAHHVPDFDATVVARLRDAGAVVLGKLNLTEGAMGGYHPDFAIPVNPWGAEYWSGASSSGSGVATAAGLCFASLGTDTGGSIRFPAGGLWCRGTETHVGARQPPWSIGARRIARSCRAADTHRGGRCHHAASDCGTRSVRSHIAP